MKPNSHNKIKCAVFDLDGTLLNTIKTINYYLNSALRMNNLPELDEESCKSFVGDGARKLISRALSHVGADESMFDKLFLDYNRLYDADPYYLTQPYDGILELLSSLKEQGINLAVLSNKPDFATKSAISHFLPNFFDIVQGAKDGIPLKPDPTSLFSVMSTFGVTEREVAYIGDSEPDVALSKSAGVRLPIMVLWGFRTAEQLTAAGADILVGNPNEIIAIIKETESNS